MDAHARMQQVFREVFDDDEIEIADDTTAHDIPDWDSLSHVALIVALESEFSLRFDAVELNGLQNVGALRRLISSKLE